MTWDIFCTVIDNYGDIGVTWRLSRQLATEHAIPVRLWVDDLRAFQTLRPEINPTLAIQHLTGVEIRHWTTPMPEVEPGEVVIEALACNLPEAFVARMAARQPAPVWINLEYLTAEDWAAGVHGLPSPHPRLSLTQYFFMPGYTANTGGLMHEAWLDAERDAFQSDTAARTRFLTHLGLSKPDSGELLISLFSYENRALPVLLQAWATGREPIHVLIPVGKALPEVATWLGETALDEKISPKLPVPGSVFRRGALTLSILPMLDQDTYDRVLWACDLNFVRGEDSFVRAQFAARPLIWQAYIQPEDAHLTKLEAFLDLYCADMTPALAQQTRMLWRAWNTTAFNEAEPAPPITSLWPTLLKALPELSAHARGWNEQLNQQPDLATNLLNSCRKWLK